MALLEREGLLGRLGELLAESERGAGTVVLVAGEAGIGKTAVVDAFCKAHRDDIELLRGACDAVVPPRPFAPVTDMAASGASSLRAALESADHNRVFDAFLELLRRPSRRARVFVVEDLHWADEATLALIRIAGRRLSGTRALIVGTYRDDEVAADHPLRLALGDLPPHVTTELRVLPLSAASVRQMVGERPIDAVGLHRATAGNPFFVTEVIAAGDDGVPVSARDAVLARAARLSAPARQVLRAASVLGERTEKDLLRDVADAGDEAIAECLERGMLRKVGDEVAFRHDIARRAVMGALPDAERSALHRRALAALQRGVGAADPGRLAYHALGAGDTGAVVQLVPAAGAWAARLGAHREAAAHYEAALGFTHGLDLRFRAQLLQAHAREASIADELDTALLSQRQALDHWRELGDRLREGDCLRELSMLVWLNGDSDQSLVLARSAVDILEEIDPPGRELARAYAVLAQRLMTAGHDDAATLAWARRALDLAHGLGYESVAVHALTTIGVTDVYAGDPTGWNTLEEGLRAAKAAGLDQAIGRAQANLVEAGRDLRRYDVVDRYAGEALAFLEEHNLDIFLRRVVGELAEVALERGRWDEAGADAARLLAESATAPVIRIRAWTLTGRLRARRGQPDAMAALDEALALSETAGEAQELCPLYAARAEAAWLVGDVGRARDEAEKGIGHLRPEPAPFWRGELAFWAWKGGSALPMPMEAAEPYRLHRSGRYVEAASAWAAIGCPYHEALALADSDDEGDLRSALNILQSLGATPMARLVRRRLRGLGARGINAGPRARTRGNPAGLTDREMEVLDLLSRGLRNSDIAERLVLSTKTVDHHVSAILRKLDVPDRGAAAAAARRLGDKDGELAATK